MLAKDGTSPPEYRTSRPARQPSAMIRFLAMSAHHGSALLALGVFGGLLIPPLAHATHWFIAPLVVCMMTVVLLRVDFPALVSHLRRPLHWTTITAFQLLVCPILA